VAHYSLVKTAADEAGERQLAREAPWHVQFLQSVIQERSAWMPGNN